MSYESEILADSPLLYWRLDETSGTVATDDSGNAYNGTYTNTPTLGESTLINADTSVLFTRSSSEHIVGPGLGSTSYAACSVEAWINADSWQSSSPYIDSVAGIGGEWAAIFLRITSGYPEFVIYVGGWKVCTGPSTLSTGTTYHIVGTHDSTTMRLYINGTEVATLGASGPATLTSGGQTFDAARDSAHGRYFDGNLDEIAFYNTTLSPTRVSDHYDAGLAIGATPTPPLATTTTTVPQPSITSNAIYLNATSMAASASVPVATVLVTEEEGWTKPTPTSFIPIAA